MLVRARFLRTVFAAGTIGTVFLTLSGPAFADASTGRFLSDPAFLPLAGEIDGSTAFTVSDAQSKTYDSTDALIESIGQHTDQFAQMLEYGFTNDLSFQVNVNYDAFDKRTRTPVGAAASSLYSSGFTDPSFGLTWRALDQTLGGSPVNLDLFGSYAPDFIDDRQATLTSGGTEGRGGQAGQLGAAVSHVWDNFTLYGTAYANFIGDRKILNPATSTASRANGVTNWAVDLRSQYRITDAFSINAGVGESFGGNTTVVNGGTGIERFNDNPNNTNFHAALNYAFIPDTLVAQATYNHIDYGTSHVNFPATPVADTTTRDHSENVWGLKLDYAFQ